MDVILNLWLKTNDTQTILFSRIILVYAIIMSLNNPISIIIQATGRVKEYHVAVEFFTLLCVPATYILFKLGYPASSAFIVMVIAAILSHIIRMICLKKYYSPFSYDKYIRSFLLPAFIITLIGVLIAIYIKQNITLVALRLITMFISSVLSVGLLVLLLGLSESEKKLFKMFLSNFRKK